MNERIKELANISISSTGLKIDVEYLTDFRNMMERFAELIIKECIEVASKQKNPHTLNYKPSERFVEDLKLHFGVKE